MKILVTGAKGFVGQNLCAQLKNIRDGKARCYGDVTVEALFEYDIDSTAEQLDEYCRVADFVFNLAGVNRPQNTAEFMHEKAYFAPELAKLAYAYATSSVPKVTVILGHAIGASFVLLGSKALGADLVYATDKAEIGALNAESGVAFAWDQYITLEKTRDDLINEWKASVSSPAVAAASGEIDDIISINELRARICSALLMLSAKGKSYDFRRKILPL